MNRERLPLVWWLAAIPIAALATSSFYFAGLGVWLWGVSAWIWFGTQPSSRYREWFVHWSTILVYALGGATFLDTASRLLNDWGKALYLGFIVVTFVLVIAYPIYAFAQSMRTPKQVRVGNWLFFESQYRHGLSLNFRHKYTWWYLTWLALPFAAAWLSSRRP